jgi:PncC family amidohydrolase
VLGVKRTDLEKNGAVSRQVVQQMVEGVCRIMRTDCGIATSGISGPDGGSLFKPVGTVWLAVKCLDKVVTECVHFKGNRDEVIESATNHGMIMLINMLRNSYMIQEDYNDE